MRRRDVAAAMAVLLLAGLSATAADPAEALHKIDLKKIVIVNGDAADYATGKLTDEARYIIRQLPKDRTAAIKAETLYVGLHFAGKKGVLAEFGITSDCSNNSVFETDHPLITQQFFDGHLKQMLVAWTQWRHKALGARAASYRYVVDGKKLDVTLDLHAGVASQPTAVASRE